MKLLSLALQHVCVRLLPSASCSAQQLLTAGSGNTAGVGPDTLLCAARAALTRRCWPSHAQRQHPAGRAFWHLLAAQMAQKRRPAALQSWQAGQHDKHQVHLVSIVHAQLSVCMSAGGCRSCKSPDSSEGSGASSQQLSRAGRPGSTAGTRCALSLSSAWAAAAHVANSKRAACSCRMHTARHSARCVLQAHLALCRLWQPDPAAQAPLLVLRPPSACACCRRYRRLHCASASCAVRWVCLCAAQADSAGSAGGSGTFVGREPGTRTVLRQILY